MANEPVPPSPHGRTPWDVLLELSRRRSILLWACLVGWVLLAAASFAWYHGLLPTRGAKATAEAGSQYLHWSFGPASSSRERCSAAAMRVQASAGASATETHDRDPTETLVVGVHGSTVTAVGCAGYPATPQSLVLVAAPEQTLAQNKEVLLRKLLDTELSR
jgi:hypothetical protein